MRMILISVAVLVLNSIRVSAQKIATLEVSMPVGAANTSVPVTVELDKITFEPDSSLVLYQIEGNQRNLVPFQLSNGATRTLNWMVTPTANASRKMYELHRGVPTGFGEINASLKDGALTIHYGNRNLLRYQYGTMYPPAGIDSAFKRSGFIHPLWTPHGQVLTRIQAPDHYHHYGIWNPWTHVLFEKDTVDFWNLNQKQGTVRFAEFVAVSSGAVYSEYKALHQHVVFKKKNGGEKVAMNELQTVRVYKPQPGEDHYIVDLTIDLNCASDSPVKILEYRYAGLGWRATEQWNKNNSEVLTSEGKNRAGSDGSTGKWFIVQGELDKDYGGAVMMSYPGNYNHPEPMRIWPENSNGVGEMFAMFAPTKNIDWLLEPGRTYTLKYRMIVFNGHFTKDQADHAWKYYAIPPGVTIKK